MSENYIESTCLAWYLFGSIREVPMPFVKILIMWDNLSEKYLDIFLVMPHPLPQLLVPFLVQIVRESANVRPSQISKN